MKDEQPWKPELPKLDVPKSPDHHEYGKTFDTNESQQQVPPANPYKKGTLAYRYWEEANLNPPASLDRSVERVWDEEMNRWVERPNKTIEEKLDRSVSQPGKPKEERLEEMLDRSDIHTDYAVKQKGKPQLEPEEWNDQDEPSQPGEDAYDASIRRNFADIQFQKTGQLPEQGKEEDRLTEVEWAKKSGFLAIAVRVQELEIENSRLKSKPTDGWSDELVEFIGNDTIRFPTMCQAPYFKENGFWYFNGSKYTTEEFKKYLSSYKKTNP